MKSIQEQINIDFKEALRSGDAFRRSALAMLKAAIANKEIEKRKKEEGLSKAEIEGVVRSEAKKRFEAAAAFRSGGDEARAKGEEAEAVLLKAYLPPEASDEDIRAAVEKAFLEVGSSSKKDFGRIMGLAVKELAGRADGARVKQIVEGMLEEQ